jgi:hypothetical protein
MAMTLTSTRVALVAVLLLTASVSAAQGTTYQARLAVVPLDVAMQSTIAGAGDVRGTLEGRTLVLNGRFSGLRSSATVARLHVSAVRGMRGAAVADLTVSPAIEGTVTGRVELTPPQLTALSEGRLYVQLHSEKAPDGNLWGWLLLVPARAGGGER